MRNIESKFKYRFDDIITSELDKSQTNLKSRDETFSRQQISVSAVDFSVFRVLIASSQTLDDQASEQVNSFTCFKCEKQRHITRNCRSLSATRI